MTYDIDARDGEINIHARTPRGRVGYLYTSRSGDRLKLADFRVEPTHRRLGFGTGMLTRALAFADTHGIRECWGEVTAEDETPHLLALYRRHGFEVVPPDAECETSPQ